MSYYFGLYLGNTNLCLAVHRDGKTEVLANAAGDRVTPAVVAFANGEKQVGLSAKQGMVRNACNTITRIKIVLGGNDADVKEATKSSKCKIVENGSFQYEISMDGKTVHYSPSEALVSLFKNMADIAKSNCHELDIPVVVTMPLTFKKQREIIRKAATDAGFRVLRVISEPAAALLAYDIGQESADATYNCMVFRMGGTTLDVTIIQVICGMYHVLAAVRETSCGGYQFTQQLSDFCSTEFQRQYKADVRENSRSVMKLNSACETCKHILSTMGSAQCFAESVYDGIDLSTNISRARFESLIAPLLTNCMKPVNEVLATAKMCPSDISKLILAGGSCKIPKLQQLFADMFPSTTLLLSISPDEVIAVGASKEARFVPQEEIVSEKDSYISTLTRGIYAKVLGVSVPTCYPLLYKGAPIPVVSQKKVLIDGSSTTFLEIYEDLGGDDKLLAKIDVPCTNCEELTLTACVEREQTLQITCSDNESLDKIVTILPIS